VLPKNIIAPHASRFFQPMLVMLPAQDILDFDTVSGSATTSNDLY
jgi:hypothetical protein